MTEEMFLHCMKYTPKAFQQSLIENKNTDAIIVLLNWSCVKGCFYTFDEMNEYINKYNKKYCDKGHWSFMVSQINKNAEIGSFGLWDNRVYINQ